MRHKILEYNAIFQKEEEGGFSVWIPTLPGCASQGENFEEAVGNIKEAIALYLEDENKKDAEEETIASPNQFMVPISITA